MKSVSTSGRTHYETTECASNMVPGILLRCHVTDPTAMLFNRCDLLEALDTGGAWSM
jgi:hypothetical protein